MAMKIVQVVRGCIDIPDPAGIAAQRETERLSYGHGIGGRTLKFLRRYQVGERLELPAHEAQRLAGLGCVRILDA
jgi:hypothetical protein